MKPNRRQIENAICRWSNYLLENRMASSIEVRQMLGEGLFKRAKTFVKNSFKHVGQGIAAGAKSVAGQLHDTFTRNKGVAKMLGAVQKLWQDEKMDPKRIKFWIGDSKELYPVQEFAISKPAKEFGNRMAIVCLYGDKSAKPSSWEQLYELLAKHNIVGDDKRITDQIDSLAIGRITKKMSESIVILEGADKLARIDAVIDALKWSEKTAKNKTNIQKLMTLLGVKDAKKILDKVKEHFKSKPTNPKTKKGKKPPKDDDPMSSDGSTPEGSSDDKGKEGDKKSEEAGKEAETNKETSPDDEKPDVDAKTPSLEENGNDFYVKTLDGKQVGVMNNLFMDVKTSKNTISILFQMSKQEKKKRSDMAAALK